MTVPELTAHLRDGAAGGLHRPLGPPADGAARAAVEAELGPLPAWMAELWLAGDGAELFCSTGPFVTLFPLCAGAGPRPEMWPAEWHVDAFTRQWRSHGARDGHWAFGITNYGGLLVARPDGSVIEWDTGTGEGLQTWPSIAECLDWIFSEGPLTIE